MVCSCRRREELLILSPNSLISIRSSFIDEVAHSKVACSLRSWLLVERALAFCLEQIDQFRRILACRPTYVDKYNALVRSRLEFASCDWSPFNSAHYLRIERIQRVFTRHVAYVCSQITCCPAYPCRSYTFIPYSAPKVFATRGAPVSYYTDMQKIKE